MRKRTVHTKIKVKRRKSKEEYVSFTKFLKIVSKRKQSVFTAPPPEKPEPVRKGKYVSFKELVTKIKKNKIAKERWGRKLRRPVKNVVKKKKVKKLVKRKVVKKKTVKRKTLKKKSIRKKIKKQSGPQWQHQLTK